MKFHVPIKSKDNNVSSHPSITGHGNITTGGKI